MNASLAYLLYRFAWGSLDLIYAPVCGRCGRPGSRWCKDCQRNVQHLVGPVCEVRGSSVDGSDLCVDCQRMRPQYRILRSRSVFDDLVRKALHKLRYRCTMVLGDALAAQLLDFVIGLKWPIEMIIPRSAGQKTLAGTGL